MYFEEKGAYTGEISPAMLVDAKLNMFVLGHSERREYFGETNEDVNKKSSQSFQTWNYTYHVLWRNSYSERTGGERDNGFHPSAG